MDPTQCLRDLLDALAQLHQREQDDRHPATDSGSRERAQQHLIALGDWLADGGFGPAVERTPDGPGQYKITTLEGLLQ